MNESKKKSITNTDTPKERKGNKECTNLLSLVAPLVFFIPVGEHE